MKKLYLVKTSGTKEFWTVEELEEGDKAEYAPRTVDTDGGSVSVDVPVVAVVRSLYSDESVDAENCDGAEDDSGWDAVALTAEEFEHLFDGVQVIDEREAEF